MGVQTGISGSASEIFACSVANMLSGFRLTISFGKTKVNDIYKISPVSKTHQEVVWFNIAMNVVATVDKLNTAYLIEVENKVEKT